MFSSRLEDRYPSAQVALNELPRTFSLNSIKADANLFNVSKFKLWHKTIIKTENVMTNSMETQILEAEEQLRLAILNSDVNALNQLLAPELIFTNHLGPVLSKEDDLMAHRSRIIKVKVLTPSEQYIQIRGNMADRLCQNAFSG